MMIEKIEVHPVVVGRSYPTVIASARGYEGVTHSYFLIIESYTDSNVTGLGEVSDIEKSMIDEEFINALKGNLERILIGENPFNVERILEKAETIFSTNTQGEVSLSHRNLLLCAVDNVLYDLMGKELGVPAHSLIGGEYRDKIYLSWVAYIRDPKFLFDEIREKIDAGFTAFKLKVGLNIEQDEERLKVVREVAGDKVQIKIDAQGYWNTDEAIRNIKRLEKFNLIGVESPVSRNNLKGMAKVRSSVDTPIIEHVNDIEFGLKLIKNDAVDVFNVSTVGCGGIYKAKKVIALAEGVGLKCLLGSTLELGIGTAAQAHLAASTKIITLPSDLIGPIMYTDDVVTEPTKYEEGCLLVPKEPGLGIELNKEKLRELTAN